MRWNARVAIRSLGLTFALLHSSAVWTCAAQLPGGKGGGSATYIDLKCGFKFTYSRMWTVTRGSPASYESPCDYRILFTRKTPRGSLIRHRVNVSVYDSDFEGFEKDENYALENGTWRRDRGVEGRVVALPIIGVNWIGMSMLDGPARCFGKNGYEGMGDRPTADLHQQSLRRAVELDGGECEKADEEGIKLMLATFEFLPIRRAPAHK